MRHQSWDWPPESRKARPLQVPHAGGCVGRGGVRTSKTGPRRPASASSFARRTCGGQQQQVSSGGGHSRQGVLSVALFLGLSNPLTEQTAAAAACPQQPGCGAHPHEEDERSPHHQLWRASAALEQHRTNSAALMQAATAPRAMCAPGGGRRHSAALLTLPSRANTRSVRL